MKLIVGRIPFLVCTPFFHRGLSTPISGVKYLDGTPSFQNKNLAEGLIHLAPSSSFAYGLHPEKYWILPELCTGSTLEIRSVKLFSKVPFSELQGKKVHLSPQSATSVQLLRLLTEVWKGIFPLWSEAPWSGNEDARLLIGDQALEEETLHSWKYSYDLASLWQEWQQLPFVFGIWIVNREVANSQDRLPILSDYRAHLQESVAQFRATPAQCLEKWLQHYPSTLKIDDLLRYYEIVDYRFSEAHKHSLALFLELCTKAGYLKENPPLHFLQ